MNNKENLLNTNNKYEKYLKQNNNYKKNLLGISFPINYNGLYFPWWGFGDYFYWYMSSNIVKKIQQYLGYGQSSFIMAINSLLLVSGFGGPLIGLIDACLFTFTASWYMDNVSLYDNGNGICLGVSILPAPTIFEVSSQDNSVSKENYFQVDYKFLAPDYITTCINAQGINYLLNYYNKDNNYDFVYGNIRSYLKKLKTIDNAGAFGSITEQDYIDWSKSFIQNDHFWLNNEYYSYLKNFVFDNKNFKYINIRTQRGTTYFYFKYYGTFAIKKYYREYSKTWEIWKN